MQLFLQLASLLGAGLILGAYAALQRRRWSSSSRLYLWCNLLGAALLTIVAAVDRRVGFVVLEAAWAAISLHALVRGARVDPPPVS